MNRLLLILLFSSSYILNAQHAILGTVMDNNGEALIGASIVLKEISKGTVTDIDGKYAINNIDAGTYTLEASYLGYSSQSIKAVIPSGVGVYDFRLSEDGRTLDEVVVVGYGVQRKREVTGSISSVKGSDLIETTTPSFESALQGQAAGLTVIQGSGLAGSGSVVRIRGASSITAGSEPLYVIDGVPIDVNYFLAENNYTNGGFNNNPLSMINPNDIESVEVLKDGAAAGIYGSRGSNGVILITTKRGKNKGLFFDVRQTITANTPTAKPDFLNGEEWLALRQEAWELDGNTGTVWIPNYTTAGDTENTKRAAFEKASKVNTDWWDEIVRTGLLYETSVGASYGAGNLRSYFGYTYHNGDSYVINNNLKKHSFKGNLDYTFNSKLKASLSTSYLRSVNRRVLASYTGGIGDAMSIALPIYPIKDKDGTFWRGEQGIGFANPLLVNESFEGFTVDKRLIANLQLHYQATDRLNFVFNGGIDQFDQNTDQFYKLDYFEEFIGSASRDVRDVQNYNFNFFGQYDVIKDDRNELKVMLGTEIQDKVTDGYNNENYDTVYSAQHIGYGDFSEGRRNFEPFPVFDETRFLSYFTRLNYSRDGKYFLQGSVRVDGSSKFGPNNKFGVFPTISGGWLLSEEEFMKDNSLFNFLKLKASYGVLGNSNIASYLYQGTLAQAGQYNNNPISYITKNPNPDLKWETTSTVDFGVEFGMFDDKLNGEIGIYRKYTDDALLQVSTPSYYGQGSFTGNIAPILNRGIEINLSFYPVQRPNFTWKTTLNGGYNYNELVSIGDYSPDALSGGTNDTRIVEGYPIGTNFLIPYVGVDPDTGAPIYLDANGEETFLYDEAANRRPVGDVLPDVTGGFGNTISWGALTLDALFVFTYGNDIYDSSSKRQLSFLTDWNVDRRVADRWQQPGDIADYPRVTLDPAAHGNDKVWFNTDLFLQDASYIRLRNLSLRYNIGGKILETLGLRSASMSLNGTNLLTFTKFPGLDPEVVRDFDNPNDRNLSPNITYLTPPQTKAYSVNFMAKF